MTELAVHVRTTTAGPVVELAGELDHDSFSQLRELLPELHLQAGRQLVVDLAGVTFCDSSGISALIAARNHALAARAVLVLAAVPGHISRILGIVGLDWVFPAYPTAQAAEAAWTPS
ncbi:STAS domain-containing protein [Streptomyces durmitorensis]|uniref:Anti-sigma factor antagonist n=1 Tax=Streptomyces durmitorensis TaxID=319947 RepID=A0ABY4PM48_9ACTN|nr:STAS domain-containing protein [Streptomyces durmitorensis]UQT54194.1 STAS domain-containing protein [Streptomyces durmitorensis]